MKTAFCTRCPQGRLERVYNFLLGKQSGFLYSQLLCGTQFAVHLAAPPGNDTLYHHPRDFLCRHWILPARPLQFGAQGVRESIYGAETGGRSRYAQFVFRIHADPLVYHARHLDSGVLRRAHVWNLV